MKRKTLTPEYVLLMVGYWCCNILDVNFAGIYLLEKGYSNGELGVILALGNLLAFLLGPVISSYVDKHKEVSPVTIACLLSALHCVMLFARLIIPSKSPLLFVTYILSVAFLISTFSMALKVYADYGHSDYAINYGLSRAAASVSMGFLSLFMGGFVSKLGTEILTYAIIIGVLMQLVAYLLIRKKTKGVALTRPDTASQQANGAEALTLGKFVQKNGGYSLMLLGVTVLFVAHNLFYSFSITVMEGVGGDDASMGVANALAVFLEMPIMLGFSRLAKHIKTKWLMLTAFVFFFVKNLFFALAGSVYGIYFAIIFQLPSYALYSIASVEFAAEVISQSDSAKAQSLAFSVAPVGNVIACAVGGFLFDSFGSKSTMAISAAVALVGMFVAIWGLKRIYAEKA